MPVEEIYIGQRSRSALVSRSVGVTSTQMLAPSPTRIAIIFCAPTLGRVTYSPDVTALLDQGITLPTGVASFAITVYRDGDLPTRGWSVISSIAGNVATVIEVHHGEALP